MSSKRASRAVKWFGTEMAVAGGRELRAGALSAVLDNGALRYVKLNGVEVLRGIAFLVRDENWGTFTPEIERLRVSRAKGGFTVSYAARCGDASRSLDYQAEIVCSPTGTLRFSVTATPSTAFITNRTGFVVLHPLRGVAGRPVTVEHVDGRRTRGRFPALIDPVQPYLNIRSLRHQVMLGVFATVCMEGDAFEMEDHRNWTDASYKTYVRPLALPWPYVLPKGQTFAQSVELTLVGRPARPARTSGTGRIAVTVAGSRSGQMPDVGVGVPIAEASHTLARADLLRSAKLAHLLCRIDGRRPDVRETAALYRDLKDRTGARIGLEIVLPGEAGPADELSRIATAIRQSGLVPDFAAVSPAADLKSAPATGAPEAAEIFAAARKEFSGVPLGGGVFSYFTELNRKRPPAHLLDYVTHTTCPIVHAADDVSVMETLEALPYVIESTRAMIAGKSYYVGPSAIACRDNPYGADVAPNPDNGRVCMAGMDPRQRGLFGAAWTLGYVAAFAAGDVASISMVSATGPAGILYRRTEYPQPWFDDADAKVYPAFHVIAGLAGGRGNKRLAARSDDPSSIAVLGHRLPAGQVLWLANLTGATRAVSVSGMKGPAILHLLDETTFAAATRDPGYLAGGGKTLTKVSVLELGPYAVARLAAM
jgi:hypothetical protein